MQFLLYLKEQHMNSKPGAEVYTNWLHFFLKNNEMSKNDGFGQKHYSTPRGLLYHFTHFPRVKTQGYL